MALAEEYHAARRDESIVRLRRILALRAMAATGMSQREIATDLGVSQPAVSQQLRGAPNFGSVDAEILLEAAAPILKQVAESRGFTEVAVFGSVARRQARPDSDIDLLVEQPAGTTISDLVRLRTLFEQILGRSVDIVTYGALRPIIDDDIRAEARLL